MGFECYGISEIKNDTFSIVVENDIIVKSKATYWFAKDLYFPYNIQEAFEYSLMFNNKNVCLLVEVELNVNDSASNNQITFEASKIEQMKLSENLFQLPSSYKIKQENVSDGIKISSEIKITDIKLKELDSISPPPPPKVLKSSIQKPTKQKSGNN